jgi:hypothetical protein
MKKNILAVLLLASFTVFAQQTFNYKNDYENIVKRTKDKQDKLFYDAQIKRFKANDATLTDFETLALLVGYSGKDSYNPTKDSFKESIIYELNGEQKFADAGHMADKELKANPLSLKGIYGKSYAMLKLQQKDSAAYYAKQWQKILKAMFLSGKGTSMADPTFSLGPDDGTEFIQMFIGAKVVSRRTQKNKEGQSVEVYEAMLDNKKLTLYFMVDHAAKRIGEEQSRAK